MSDQQRFSTTLEQQQAEQQRAFAHKYAAATDGFNEERQRLNDALLNSLSTAREHETKRTAATTELQEFKLRFDQLEEQLQAQNGALASQLEEVQSAFAAERFELKDSIKEFRRASELYQTKWERDREELDRVSALLAETTTAQQESVAELVTLRSENSSLAIALKASRDGTKSLQAQRDGARKESAEMGMKAAGLRAEVDSTTALLAEIKALATSLGADLSVSTDRCRSLEAQLAQEQAEHAAALQAQKEAQKQALGRLDARCAKLKAESEEHRMAWLQAQQDAAAQAEVAQNEYRELEKRLEFSVSEVEGLLVRNEQLENSVTELKLIVWSGSDEDPKQQRTKEEVDAILMGQARRLGRVFHELSPPGSLIPAMGRVSDGHRFNNKEAVDSP